MKKAFKNYIYIFILALTACVFLSVFCAFYKKSVVAESYSPSASDSYFSLRDNNLILTEQQGDFGLCWDFTMLNCLESYLSIKTGQIYDFSEVWIAVCNKVENNMSIGGGGTYSHFEDIVKKYGLVLEEDLPYSVMQNIDDNNYETIFNEFKDKTIKTYTKNLTMIEMKDDSQVKQYLISNGAVYLPFDSTAITDDGTFSYAYSTSSTPDHAITLIGWDDKITFKDINNLSHTGAWICLNTWGIDKTEIVYISYDDVSIKQKMVGINVNMDVDYTLSSNSSLINYDVNRYNSSVSSTSTGSYNQKNVFYYGENIDLEYLLTSTVSVEIDIVKDGVSVNDKFSKIKFTHSKKLIDVEASNLDCGTYNIIFKVDTNANGIVDGTYINQIFVMSGAETCSVMTDSIITKNGQDVYSTYDRIYQGFNTTYSQNNNVIYGYVNNSSTSVQVVFNFSSLSKVTSLKLASGDTSIRRSLDGFTPATTNSYSRGSIVLQFDNITKYKQYNYQISFTTQIGTVNFKVVLYKYATSETKTFVFYRNFENTQNTNYSYIVVGTNYTNTLSLVSQKYKRLVGYYTDSTLTTQLENNTIYPENITYSALTNYRDKSIQDSTKAKHAFVFVYASWQDLELKFDDMQFGATYGDSINFKISSAYNGSENYSYSLSETNKTGFDFNLNTLTLSGKAKSAGEFTILIVATDNELNTTKTATITITISKRNIKYQIDDKQSAVDKNLVTLSGSVVEGEVYNLDDLGIQLSTDANSSLIGTYSITGTSSNSNYNVTFVNGTYKVVSSIFNINVYSYYGTYDGENHSLSVEVDEGITYTVLYGYSKESISYSILQFKDAMEQTRIYALVSADGYSDQIVSGTVTILPKQVNVTWTNLDLTYNTLCQSPTISGVSGMIGSEQVNVTVEGGKTNAGSYTATAISSNANYFISNSQTTYTISKAKPNLANVTITIDAKQVGNATYLSDITLPANYVWENPDTFVDFGTNTYTIKYVPADSNNYLEVSGIEITLTKVNVQENLTKIVVIVLISAIVLSSIASMLYSLIARAKERQLLNPKQPKNAQPKQEDQFVTIEFVTNAPLTLEPIIVPKREISSLPKLERRYYEFCGWYTDKLFLNKYTNNGTNSKLTLYAKWKPKL